MLHSLGHDPFIQGDHKQSHIDTAHTGEHVLQKLSVAGYIYESDHKLAICTNLIGWAVFIMANSVACQKLSI